MKHIKKKYLFIDDLENLKISKKKVIKRDDRKSLKFNKTDKAFLHTKEEKLIKGFIYNYNGNYTVVPIPDLTLVYFDHAYHMNKVRANKKSELFLKLSGKEEIGEDATNEIYYYYGHASSCIISLFTAIESFVNHLIPGDKPYKKEGANKTELYNKVQIQKNISFNEKINQVLPYFYKNTFHDKSKKDTQLINNLKNLRDDIIHTKSETSFELQERLLRRVLNFSFDKSFLAVQNFMNFYKPDYVSECNCGLNY